MKSNNIKLTPVDVDSRKKLDFKTGDTVSVWSKIVDEKGPAKGGGAKGSGATKYRLQAFEGIVLARKHGTEIGATFTLRKVASGVGVERIFPLFSPAIDRIEITKRARARRSKLYYVRDKAVKDVRRKMRSVTSVSNSESSSTQHTEGKADEAGEQDVKEEKAVESKETIKVVEEAKA